MALPPFPIPPQQIVLTVATCIIVGIIFMGALLKRKKTLAKRYQDNQEEDKSDKNEGV